MCSLAFYVVLFAKKCLSCSVLCSDPVGSQHETSFDFNLLTTTIDLKIIIMFPCQCGRKCKSQGGLKLHEKTCQQVMDHTATTALSLPKKIVLKDMYDAYNASVFGGRLPSTMSVSFSDDLGSKAGMTRFTFRRLSDGKVDPSSINAEIFIASQTYFNRESYIANTLVHEMCHAANVYIDHMTPSKDDAESHGPLWVKWTDLASAVHPELGKITQIARGFIKWTYRYLCDCNQPKRKDELIDWHLKKITGSQTRKAEGDACPQCHAAYVLL